jgi:3-hydroxy acid dehydrogenase / malonic semialdehyde reductase
MNKTILITGATSGIGKSTAYLFAKHQYNLILTGRRKERLASIEADLKSTFNIDIQTLCFDVRNAIEVQQAMASIDKVRFPIIDILLNNAGLAAGFGSIDEGQLSDWDVMIDTNVKGLLYVSKEIIPWFKAQGYGHIINISSTAGKDVYANGNVYCASKHAVDALTQSMRIDLLNDGIKVTSINPGACETEFSIVRFKGDEEKANKIYEGFTPLKPEDVADAIFYTATLPKHVCVNDLTLTCLTQANANYNVKRIV